jgi:hypothetical protein
LNGAKKKGMSNWKTWPPEFTYSQKARFPGDFPNLKPQDCENGISAATDSYNCIAWAAFDHTQWWEPDTTLQYYWPDHLARGDYSLNAYVAAFRAHGFEICGDDSREIGFEKIAIYTLRNEPQHAARQVDDSWTSKLGPFEDIQHADLDCLSGPFYGTPNVYMKRPIKTS